MSNDPLDYFDKTGSRDAAKNLIDEVGVKLKGEFPGVNKETIEAALFRAFKELNEGGGLITPALLEEKAGIYIK